MIVGLAILLLVAVAAFVRKVRNPDRPALSGCLSALGFLGLMIWVFLGVAVGPMGVSRYSQWQNSVMQSCRTIGLAEFQYANDQDGRYPDGNSSTEVFQELIDGNYISDPAIFYVPMSGKTPARPGERLKPENVCFDVTGGVTSSDPDPLPLVFLTGFKVDYRPGGRATSLTTPYPLLMGPERTWWEWLNGQSPMRASDLPGMAVSYKSNSASSRQLDLQSDEPGQVGDFVSKDFDAHGKTYRQLTPDGVLK